MTTEIPLESRLITCVDAAALARVSIHTIYYRIRVGDLKRYRSRRNVNNQVFVDAAEVEKIYGIDRSFVADEEKK